MTADRIIAALRLQPHPEGGYYRETYRAPESIAAEALPPRFDARRTFSTAILYLLQADQFSALHRIRSDEVWHFHMGEPLEVVEISDAGQLSVTVLGHDLAGGAALQAVVQAGRWFGARLAEPRPGAFAVAGCTVAPGFDFDDFEVGGRNALIEAFPLHEAIITAMTRA